MLGSVTTCNLVNPHNYNTNIEGGYIVHKITITPTEMTLHHFAAFLGTKFHWSVLKVPVDSRNEITFSTCKKGAGGEYPSVSSVCLYPHLLASVGAAFGSPVHRKNPKFYSPPKHMSTAGDVTPWHTTPFPPFLDFETDGGSLSNVSPFTVYLLCLLVPIYDARGSNFTFDKTGFNSLQKLPRYGAKGVKLRVDLSLETLVAVAYTANIYGVPPGISADTDMEGACPTLSLNVQFVILLGQL